MFCAESSCFFTSLMNENIFSCVISRGNFSHITVALYEIVIHVKIFSLRAVLFWGNLVQK